MEKELKALLDKTYELEGLIHLALLRDNLSEDFYRLIEKKGHEIKEECEIINSGLNASSFENTDLNSDSYLKQDFDLDEYSLEETVESEDTFKFQENPQIPEVTEVKNLPSLSPNEIGRQGRLVFSINDRYRFKKELFDNSDIDFNNTLALVASMDNYEEAEEYFINEENMDMHNTVVKDFLLVIKKYFK